MWSAADFMSDFYNSFAEGRSAAASLSAAVDRARHADDGRSVRPLWAAFTLVGDGSVRVIGRGALGNLLSGWNILILLGVLVAGAILIRRQSR